MLRTGPVPAAPKIDFSSRVTGLLRQEHKVFRLSANTVGVADPELMSSLVATRAVLPGERSVFKPVRGKAVSDELAMRVIRALGEDVNRALESAVPSLAGKWPRRGQTVLRDMLFGTDGARLSALTNPRILDSDAISRGADMLVAAFPGDSEARSSLSRMVTDCPTYPQRRHIIALYRRASALLIGGLSGLVANASWLLSHRDTPADVTNSLWETMRLLPTAWMLWRTPDPEYTELHPLIGKDDSIALFPLLMHRDPDFWEAPDSFIPERWEDGDGYRTPGFAPFGLLGARCWARHLIIPLAQRLIEELTAQRLRPRVRGDAAPVPLRSLLSVRVELAAA
ncbi:cytochrome P450 [Amycolatopsis sp. cg5]|uniref:cytochrome P450 n=1 Tax=Amycolatopsis sp. cg5 TaxID=3238802 RepID=UPI003525DA55